MATKKKIVKKKVVNKVAKKKVLKKKGGAKKSVIRNQKASKKTSASERLTGKSSSKIAKKIPTETGSIVEQSKENVMPYEKRPTEHQRENQEKAFQTVLRKLCEQGTNGDNFRENVLNNNELENWNLSAEQKCALIAVGHASGIYTYEPASGQYCCCCC